MRVINHTLIRALALSLALHALVFAAGDWLYDPERRAIVVPAMQLDVMLQPREIPAKQQPRLLLDESPQTAVRPPAPVRPAHEPSAHVGHVAKAPSVAASAAPLSGDAARQANAQMARELLYPPEAIARGLEGEVLVLLFLDASGNAIAARLETSSGHALLDDAAVRAARTLRALPDSAPREVLLPVRFRLH
jgi:periplasmic protein TonB